MLSLPYEFYWLLNGILGVAGLALLMIGRLPLGGGNAVTGLRARIIGAVLMLPGLALLGAEALSFAVNHQMGSFGEEAMGMAILGHLLTPVCPVIAAAIAYVTARPGRAAR